MGVIEGAWSGDAMRSHNRDSGLVHAVHNDLDFVYATFGVCDCDGASFEDGRNVVLSLNVSGGGMGSWRWGVGAAELFLNVAFKYLRAGCGEPGDRKAGSIWTGCKWG